MPDKKYVYEFIADAKSLFSTFSQIVVEGRNAGKELKKEFDTSAKNLDAAFKTLKLRPFAEIQKDIQEVQNAFKTLKDSGTLSAEQINAAHVAMKGRVKELSNEMSGLTGESKKMAEQFKNLASVAKGVVITFLTRESLRAFGEFDAKMREVWQISDITREKMDQVSRSVLNLSMKIPESAANMAAAQIELAGAGIAVENSGKALELSARAAVAGMTDSATAAKVGTSIMQAFRLSVSDLGSIYETLFATVRDGVGTFQEVSAAVASVAPTARVAGVGVNELTAAFAVLEDRGIKLPAATTAIDSALKTLTGSNDKLKEAGVTWSGLIPTLELLQAKGLDTAESLKEVGIRPEARTTILTLIEDLDKLKQKNQEFASSTGAFDEAYKKNAESYKNQIKLLENAVNALAVTIGGELAQQLTPLIKALGIIVQSLVNMDPVMRKTILYFGEFYAVLKLVQGAAGLYGYIKAMAAATAVTEGLGTTATVAGGLMRAGIVAAGVVGAIEIAKLVVELKKLWDALRQKSEIDLGLEKQVEQWKQYKDFQLKTITDLQRFGPEKLRAYYEELVKANNLFQAEAAKAGTERGFFDLMFGPDESKAEAEAKKKANMIEKQIQAVKALLKGEKLTVEGEIIVDANLDQIEGTIDRVKKKIDDMVSSLEGNRNEWSQIESSSLRYLSELDGINLSSSKLKEIIASALTPQQALARVMLETKETSKALNLTYDQRVARQKELEKAVQNVFAATQQTADIDKKINDLNAEKIAQSQKNGIVISESMEAQEQAFARLVSASGTVSASQMKAIDDVVGYGLAKGNELQAFFKDQKYTFNLDEEGARAAFEKLKGMTEEQRIAWIQTNGTVQNVTKSIQDLGAIGAATGAKVATDIGSGVERSIGFMKTGIDTIKAILDGQTFDISVENAEAAMKELGKMTEDQKIKFAESHKAFAEQIAGIKGVADESTKAIEKVAAAATVAQEVTAKTAAIPAVVSVGATRTFEAVPAPAIPAAPVTPTPTVAPEQTAALLAEADKKKAVLVKDLEGLKTQIEEIRSTISGVFATAAEAAQAAMIKLFNPEQLRADLEAMLVEVNIFVTETVTLYQNLFGTLAGLYEQDRTLYATATQAKLDAGTAFVAAYSNKINELTAGIDAEILKYRAMIAELKGLGSEASNLVAEAPAGYARGGPVRGGVSGVDSVPILAMGGEYVMRRSAVQKYGAAFFEALNRGMVNLSKMASPKAMRFAAGGMVPSPVNASLESNIRIVNVVDSEAMVAPFLKSRKGENVILNTLKDNKDYIRSLVVGK